jgi:hypothetical protein
MSETAKPLFAVGDIVKIVKGGYGCHPETIGNLVKIIENGPYKFDGYTYKIDNTELQTNGKTNHNNGFIWETSFELSVPATEINNQKTKKMARIKNITKNKAQEIRTIDTSLINKEEVFKMLALAESTGLPCLLVGQPGK